MRNGTFLKVVSIIMVVFAGIGLFGLALAAAGVAVLRVMDTEGAGMVPAVMGLVLGIIGVAAQLLAGIKGIRAAEDPYEAGKCVKWGIIIIALNLLADILNVLVSGEFSMSDVTGLILPILYIIAAAEFSKQ